MVAARPHVAKQSRAVPWGPWRLAPLHPGGGAQKGWGATCGNHKNEDGTVVECKSSISRASMSNDECLLRMKMWLLLGQNIEANDKEGRTKHLHIDVRTIPVWDAEDIEYLCPAC